MKFADIGQQLRAYRMESGMRAEEIAARLGVSRAPSTATRRAR
jgi:transcriptional regulator with XRE-family HTH domain